MIPPKPGAELEIFSGPDLNCAAIPVERVVDDEDWKPQKIEWFIMLSMALISLVVAIDATILVAVLPVRHLQTSH
jgi:hypothetical protein